MMIIMKSSYSIAYLFKMRSILRTEFVPNFPSYCDAGFYGSRNLFMYGTLFMGEKRSDEKFRTLLLAIIA